METEICTDKGLWEERLKHGRNREFLQSWEWGVFQEKTGKKAIRLLLGSGTERTAVQGFSHQLPFGLKYLYCPRAGHLSAGHLTTLRAYTKQMGYAFVRIEPAQAIDVPKDACERASLQPQQTMVLDLTQAPVTLLGDMHAKTRYNIHLAERKGVMVRTEKNSEIFWKLNVETTRRDRFVSHDKSYYEQMLSLDMVHQVTAYLADVPIASHILVAYGDTLTYLHGASGNTARNVMAPYALQWASITFGQSLGLSRYDLWGVAPEAEPHQPQELFHRFGWQSGHRWHGVTKFKAGFGGSYHAYPKAFDLPCMPFHYHIYRTLQSARRALPF